MKWNRFTLKTKTEAEDIVICTLAEVGIEGVEIQDKQPLTDEDKAQMFVDIMPEGPADDGIAYLNFYLEEDAENLDGLNFLTNQNMSVVNRKALEGVILAHTEGGVPQVILEVEDVSEKSLGYLIYFFEKACAVSGYLLGVNPFNQPGVESYKKNMFALLGKPGYEDQKAALEAKLSK